MWEAILTKDFLNHGLDASHESPCLLLLIARAKSGHDGVPHQFQISLELGCLRTCSLLTAYDSQAHNHAHLSRCLELAPF